MMISRCFVRFSRFAVVAIATTLTSLVACSGGPPGTNCAPPAILTADACTSCITGACQTTLTAACDTGGAFSSCYCTCAQNGGSDASCALSCSSSSCQGTAATCISTALAGGGSCATACATSGGPGGGVAACQVADGCAELKDLTPAGVTSANTNCPKSGGTVVSSCPVTGLLGCCKQAPVATGDYLETCFYSGNAMDLQSECTGPLKGAWVSTP
jgi:hypothetical protein